MIVAGLIATRFSLNRIQRRRDQGRREKSSRVAPAVRVANNPRRVPGGGIA